MAKLKGDLLKAQQQAERQKGENIKFWNHLPVAKYKKSQNTFTLQYCCPHASCTKSKKKNCQSSIFQLFLLCYTIKNKTNMTCPK